MLARHALTIAGTIGLLAGSASAGYLVVASDTGDKLVQLSAFDGSLINDPFVDLDVAFQPISTSTKPWNAIGVGNEIWVTDESRDHVFRLTNTGDHIGAISGIDDPAGITRVGDTVYVIETAVATGDRVSMIDTTMNAVTGTFPLLGRGADVHPVGNQLFVSNVDTNDIDVYDLAGNYVSTIVDGDDSIIAAGDIYDPRQITTNSAGNLLVASGGSTGTTGIFEFDTTGTLINHFLLDFTTPGGSNNDVMGVFELGNGNYLYTQAFGGAKILDPATGVITPVAGIGTTDDYVFIEYIVPTPGALSVAALAGLVATRRRRTSS